jgi:hypothetical protein
MSAQTGLGPLPYLDLDRGGVLQVLRVHPEAAGSHFRADVVRVDVEVLMQPPLAGTGDDVELLGRHEQCLLGVVRDRSQ